MTLAGPLYAHLCILRIFGDWCGLPVKESLKMHIDLACMSMKQDLR